MTEFRKSVDPSATEPFRPPLTSALDYFESAWAFTSKFYSEELERIGSVVFDQVTPEFFFREVIWVIHATGFSAAAVSSFFPDLILSYGDFRTLPTNTSAVLNATLVCNNPQKINAIVKIASLMNSIIPLPFVPRSFPVQSPLLP